MPVLASRWLVPGAVESTLEGRIQASDIDELMGKRAAGYPLELMVVSSEAEVAGCLNAARQG